MFGMFGKSKIETVPCENCNYSGFVPCDFCGLTGRDPLNPQKKCKFCRGTLKVKCSYCKGRSFRVVRIK